MLKKRPKPPDGYKLVNDGKVRRDDFVWDISIKKWVYPNKYDCKGLGTDVVDFHATCRKEEEKNNAYKR